MRHRPSLLRSVTSVQSSSPHTLIIIFFLFIIFFLVWFRILGFKPSKSKSSLFSSSSSSIRLWTLLHSFLFYFSLLTIRRPKQYTISEYSFWRFCPLSGVADVAWFMSSMMNHHPRRILPPGGTRKRKEREGLGLCFSPGPPPPTTTAYSAPAVEAGNVMSQNRLLASYMAHEFLTKGTLFGQKFEPAGAEALALSTSNSAAPAQPMSVMRKEHHSYAEVASIVKSDGTHIPGIVNPTQLSRWMQIWRGGFPLDIRRKWTNLWNVKSYASQEGEYVSYPKREKHEHPYACDVIVACRCSF